MKTPTKVSTSRAGRYGVANSAGPIEYFEGDPTFKRLKDAKAQAEIESKGGRMGECWAFKWVAPKGTLQH